jgi:hypothetical protein
MILYRDKEICRCLCAFFVAPLHRFEPPITNRPGSLITISELIPDQPSLSPHLITADHQLLNARHRGVPISVTQTFDAKQRCSQH